MRWLVMLVAVAACERAGSRPTLEVDPKAQPIVDAWAEAIGGRERIALLTASHSRGNASWRGGAMGTFESFETRKGEHRVLTVWNGVRREIVFDGVSGWAIENGGVRDLTPSEAETELYSSFMESFSMFFPDRRGGRIQYVSGNQIAMTPKGTSQAILVTFDEKHFPVEVAIPTWKVRLTDWSEFHGVQMPTDWIANDIGLCHITAVDDATSEFTKPTVKE